MKDSRILNLEDLQYLFYSSRPTQEAVELMTEHGLDLDSKFLLDLLRWHGDFAIANAKEIRRRFSFDCLLNFYGILELALLAHYVPDPLPSDLQEQARAHLSHPAVRRYYIRHYPEFLPYLLLNRLEGKLQLREPNIDDRALSLFTSFISLTTAYEAQESIRRFEWFLDGGSRRGYGLPDLLNVLEKPELLWSVLLNPVTAEMPVHQATRGFYDFLRFCINLRQLLADSEPFPFLRSGMWFHYAYWFDVVGRRVADNMKNALSRFLSWEEKGIDGEELRSFVRVGGTTIEELVSPTIGKALRDASGGEWPLPEQLVNDRSVEVTLLLQDMESGDREAASKLMPLVYGELSRLAAHYLRFERPGHTLEPTALVHEVYLKLATGKGEKWQNRAHFISVAARAMKRVLVDYARTRRRSKRRGTGQKLSLVEPILFPPEMSEEVLDLDLALTKLETMDPRQCKIVELRCFGGLTIEEISELLGTSPATVKREWSSALAWLSHEMGGT